MMCTGSKVTKAAPKPKAGRTLLQKPGSANKSSDPQGVKVQKPVAPGKEAPSKGKFFAVYHTFKSADTATAFLKFLTESKPEDIAKMNAEWDAMGFHNHVFLRSSILNVMEGPTLCIWETKNETTVADFQAFIDSDKGPGAGVTFHNRVTLAAPGSVTPGPFFDKTGKAVRPPQYVRDQRVEVLRSDGAWTPGSILEVGSDKLTVVLEGTDGSGNQLRKDLAGDTMRTCVRLPEAAPPRQSTGAFFWVDHAFKTQEAATAFWKCVTERKPEETARLNAEWDAMGFHNHFCILEGVAGRTVCIWESKSDMTAVEFQAFMTPGGGNNEVHKVAEGSAVPSAFFITDDCKPVKEELPGLPTSKFFAVYHTFKSADAASAFWKFVEESKPEDMAKMNAEWDAMGFHNHFFLPDGGENPALCIWETKTATTVAKFQAFIDSDKGPGAGVTFNNRVTIAAPGSVTPQSFFDKAEGAATATQSAGAFFWVDHTFKSEEAAAAFWKFVTESKPEDAAKLNAEWDAMGFHNHFFLPEGGAGRTICVWESKSDITALEFQAFIDSEKAPGRGITFNNEVHKVAQGGAVPASFFAAQVQKSLAEKTEKKAWLRFKFGETTWQL